VTEYSDQPPITLYTYASSPFAAKTYFYLVYKRLDFELVYVHPLKRNEIAFTNQGLIPVLKIGDEWRIESSEHGAWLDELFPQGPLLGHSAGERAALITLEKDVSLLMMTTAFRSMGQPRSFWEQLREGWNLGKIMRKTSLTPAPLVPIWPFLIRRAPFLKHASFMLQPKLGPREYQAWALDELERLIASGPYIGGREILSQADLTAYSAIYISCNVPLAGAPDYLARPIIKAWVETVEAQLPDNLSPKLFLHARDRV
jgi:glutathione S-transferase